MPNDIPFKVTGTVSQLFALQGSYCNVRLDHGEGCEDTVHTVGFCQDIDLPEWPQIGERIRITGIIRNDRHLTKFWERA
jgi:hypothetical protein